MKILLAAFAAALFTATPASAAVVTYAMTFKDLTGVVVGNGQFSYDPAVMQDIFVNDDGDGQPPATVCLTARGRKW